MLAAAANTSAGPNNGLRKTDKSGNVLANPQLSHPSSSILSDGKENVVGQTRANCVQDYSPCSCKVVYDNQSAVLCEDVSLETVREVFQRVNDPEIFELELFKLGGDTNTFSVPLDFLGNTTVTSYILIDCIGLSGNSNPNLVIDPSAFRLSQNSLAKFTVRYCDFGLQKDLNFLSGFNKLEELRFYAANNFSVFQYLPTLPSLQYLDVTSCRGLEQIAFPDLSPAKLKALSFDSNKISDQTADEILTKLVASNSADSLEFLNLNGNYLTKIPSQVGSVFPQLKTAHIGANNISYIPSSSVTIAYPLESLYLGTNGLKTIESGAFQGKATSARAIILFFGLKKKQNNNAHSIGFYNRKFHNDLCHFVVESVYRLRRGRL